jgi:uncharacterized protein (UPF0332 family)
LFKTIKIKKHEKTWKQLNELREDFSKLQNETKESIKKEREHDREMEYRRQNKIGKRRLTKIWKISEKKYQTEILEKKCSLNKI